jgi:hypothetical protein
LACATSASAAPLDYVSLAELATVSGRLGLPVERARHFRADRPLSAYAEAAQTSGAIAT